jgi:hypothetical protein
MRLGSTHQSNELQPGNKPARKRSPKLLSSLLAQTIVVALAATPQQAVAATPARVSGQAVSPLCMVGGAPIVPQPSVSQPYAWAFVANFDHANSTTVTTACLAERTLGNSTVYTLLNCPISNNAAGQQFGNGAGRFNGSAYATCSVVTALATVGPPFAIGARATFPAAGVTYPIVSSPDLELRVTRNAGCTLTPFSRYDGLSFNHTSGAVGCVGLHAVFSKVQAGAGGTSGLHRVNGALIGQSNQLAGSIQVATTFAIQLGASSGGSYQLDYVFIDPRGGSCCGGG